MVPCSRRLWLVIVFWIAVEVLSIGGTPLQSREILRRPVRNGRALPHQDLTKPTHDTLLLRKKT
jgi:hypothetical protein